MKSDHKTRTNRDSGRSRKSIHPSKLKGKSAEKKRKPASKPVEMFRIENTIERISDGFVAFDSHMNYIYLNQRGGEIMGLNRDDLMGKNFWDVFPEVKGTSFGDAYV